jgi:hypothetical protein
MIPMQKRLTLWTLAGVFLLAAMGGVLFAQFLSIPASIAVPVAAALAIEACLYVAAVLESARAWIEAHLRPAALAVGMTVSGVAPYCVYAVPAHTFSLASFAMLALAAAAISFWFVLLPRRPASGLAFLTFVAGVSLSPLFPAVFGRPWPSVPLAIAGQLMWTRLAFLEVLSVARMEVRAFGFLPSRREWAAGFVNFALFVPVGILLGLTLHFGSFHLKPMPWWRTILIAAGTFLGRLRGVALR